MSRWGDKFSVPQVGTYIPSGRTYIPSRRTYIPAFGMENIPMKNVVSEQGRLHKESCRQDSCHRICSD